MTEQERINENLQRQIDAQNARVGNVLAKVDMLITELRDRDNQRGAEIRELRQDLKDMQKSSDAKIDKLESKIDKLESKIEDIGKHVRNLVWTGMAAVGGMFVAVGAMVATVIYSIFKS